VHRLLQDKAQHGSAPESTEPREYFWISNSRDEALRIGKSSSGG
jgi:hypothetical protein